MPTRIKEGWQVLGRTKAGELHPCYFCSRTTPKFEVGWRVQLVDGAVITVGPVCGRRHLGERFTIDKRAIEEAEELASLQRRRRAWLDVRGDVEAVAEHTLAHDGLRQFVRIKERTLNMNSQAAAHLNRIAAGAVAGVPPLLIFEHGNPRRQARDVLDHLQALAHAEFDRSRLAAALRAIDKAVQHHNDRVEPYAAGCRALSPAMIARIDEELPGLSYSHDGDHLILRRRSDGLSDRLPLPADLELVRYPVPQRRPGEQE